MTTHTTEQTATDILGPAPEHFTIDRACALIDILTNKSRSNTTRASALDELLMSWSPPAQRDDIGNFVREQLALVRDADIAAQRAKADEAAGLAAAVLAEQTAREELANVRPPDIEPEITITSEPVAEIAPTPAPSLGDLLADAPVSS